MSQAFDSPWFSLLFGTPFLRVQTILQTQDLIPTLKFNPVKGALDCFRRIKKQEGVRFFWRSGIPYFLHSSARYFFDAATSPFALFEVEIEEEEIKNKSTSLDATDNNGVVSAENGIPKEATQETESIQDPNKIKSNVTKKFIVEGVDEENILAYSGLPLSSFILVWNLLIHPIEVLRVRLATDFLGKDGRQYKGMFNAGKKLINSDGIRALYKGFVPLTSLMLIQQNLFYFILSRQQEYHISAALGIAVETLLYPLILVSSRMMMWPDNPLGKYRNMRECFQGTYKEFGIKGFYKGFQVTLFLNAVAILLDLTPEIDLIIDENEKL